MDGEVDMGFIQADKLTYTYEGNLVPAVKEVSLSFEKDSYTAKIRNICLHFRGLCDIMQ